MSTTRWWPLLACLLSSLAPPLAGDPFGGLTRLPVDLEALHAGQSISQTRIRPYFNFDNTSHAEGPKKWYLYGPKDRAIKVFLPAAGSLTRHGISTSGRTRVVTVGGEKCHLDMQATFRVSRHVQVFFMHLCLRDAVRRRLESGPVHLPAGAHIGYIHNPPWNSLDFGILDSRHDSRMASRSSHWWNRRANPFDYFTVPLKKKILAAYAPTYARLKAQGLEPYADLTDSRSNINVPGKIWGVWFKDDLRRPFERHRVNWSIVNLVPRRLLHQPTAWKLLKEHPTMSGLFTENGQGVRRGTALYPGEKPIGRSRFHRLSGDDAAGTARIVERWRQTRTVYIKYRVTREKLWMQSFPTAEAARSRPFGEKKVVFRRDP